MKVALIHDHLAQAGGAEKVLKALVDIYPNAPIYTLLYEKKHVNKYFKDRRIETSVIQRMPGGVKYYRWFMPFMPMAVEFFDLTGYDLVISDASAFAKGVITSPDTLHICYCHTPTRYLWDYTHQYINELDYNKYFKKLISLVLSYVRMWDKLAADRVDIFIANSRAIKKRIKKYYRRDSKIIYPPVDVDSFSLAKEKGDYYLIGGRLAAYKRVDIVIKAFLKNKKKLKIFGSGVDMPRLKKIAEGADNIEFLGRIDGKDLPELYSKALAFINPQVEDFGITAVEAMASGTPVIAYNKGGARETVVPGRTGVLFSEQTVDSLVKVIDDFKPEQYSPNEIRTCARQFSTSAFKETIKIYIEKEYEKFKMEDFKANFQSKYENWH